MQEQTSRAESRDTLITSASLVVFAIASRLLFNYLHVFNFNAVMAAALFGGAYLTRSKISMWIPIATLLVTDLILGVYDWKLMAVVYGAFMLTFFIGKNYGKNPTLLRYVASVLGGSLSFFVLTNFAVWLFGDGSFYPHTVAGLTQCFAMAVPFYRNTAISDLLFTTVMFGSYYLLELRAERSLTPIKIR